MKAAWKFLGDEAGRKLPRLPARMRHQRGEKRYIVADTVDHEGIERIALRSDCRRPRRRMVWQTRITRGDGKLCALVTQTQLVLEREK